MSNLLLAFGIAAVVPGVGFYARWLCSPTNVHHWSGWAATVCFTVATFAIVLGNLIR